MEELQDAIEDAQYVNAISTQEDGPRPVLAWEIPNEEQLATWKLKVGKKEGAFGLDATLKSAIGLFLFSAFLKDTCNDYLRINFCEEVLRWRRLRGRQRVEKARKVIVKYLSPPKKDDSGAPILPQKTEIDEFDLERPPYRCEDLENQISENWKENSENSCTGLDGPVRDRILSKMEAVEQARASRKEASSVGEGAGNGVEPKELIQTEKPSAEEGPPVSSEAPTEATNETTEEPSSSETVKDESPVVRDESPRVARAIESVGKHSFQIRHDRKQPTGPRYLPDDFFDDAEGIIMETLKRQYWTAFQGSEQYTKLLNFLWYMDRRVVPEDFFVMRVLGRGGFGLVTACKKGTSGKLYAMKVMNKRRIKMKKSEQLALNERAALAAVESPFVVNLKYSFHSKEDVFLILDLMTGGDLGYHLHQKGRFPKNVCVYYAARIMLGLQALHDKKYVYRDLKPENCLLADDGRVKITDLGLATKITPTLHGAAGTRGYWAPEMLRRDARGRRMPYGHTVDWFSFGCCLAEFISGQNPFRSEAALNFGLEKGKQTKVWQILIFILLHFLSIDTFVFSSRVSPAGKGNRLCHP